MRCVSRFRLHLSPFPSGHSGLSRTAVPISCHALRGPRNNRSSECEIRKRLWRFGVYFAVPSARFSLLRVCPLSRIPFGVGWSLQIPSLPFREGVGVGLCSASKPKNLKKASFCIFLYFSFPSSKKSRIFAAQNSQSKMVHPFDKD